MDTLEKYFKTEETIENAGFQRISGGVEKRPREEDDEKVMSSFMLPRVQSTDEQLVMQAGYTGIHVIFDKKSRLVVVELWEFPPPLKLSNEARADIEQVVKALGAVFGEAAFTLADESAR